MLIVLDRGHGDKGAGKLDPGVVAGGLREIDLTGAYISHATDILRAAGHQVVTLDSGTYDARHRLAMDLSSRSPGRALYVQCHVNAGGGRYAAAEHDARSTAGRRAAAALMDATDDLEEIRGTHVWALQAGDRGWVCIDDIYAAPRMCGVIFEPGFIDAPQHAPLWTPPGLRRVGAALALGVQRYASTAG